MLRQPRLATAIFCAAIAFAPLSKGALAQDDVRGEASAGAFVLIKPSPLFYPQMARAARVSGDVTARIIVRRDGTVASAEIVSGSPLLKAAVLQNVQESIYECRSCTHDQNFLSLTYTFNLREDIDCGFKRVRTARCFYLGKCGYRDNYVPRRTAVSQSGNHIIVLADELCVETTTAKASQT